MIQLRRFTFLFSAVLACPLERNLRFCEWSQLSGDGGNWRLKKARGRSYGDDVDGEDDGMSGDITNLIADDAARGRGRWRRRRFCRGGPRQALSGKRGNKTLRNAKYQILGRKNGGSGEKCLYR